MRDLVATKFWNRTDDEAIRSRDRVRMICPKPDFTSPLAWLPNAVSRSGAASAEERLRVHSFRHAATHHRAKFPQLQAPATNFLSFSLKPTPHNYPVIRAECRAISVCRPHP
jgi:hypothetical protein